MDTETIHATAVSFNNRALLFIGQSGAGKSASALQMMSLGATLVADDRTVLRRSEDGLIASPAPNIAGQIEARHLGILTCPHQAEVPVAMVVDLDTVETERLPPLRHIKILGLDLPLYRRVAGPHFIPTLLLLLDGSTPMS